MLCLLLQLYESLADQLTDIIVNAVSALFGFNIYLISFKHLPSSGHLLQSSKPFALLIIINYD